MHGPAAEALSCVLLAVVLAAAITRPKWLPEAAAAGLAAVAVIACRRTAVAAGPHRGRPPAAGTGVPRRDPGGGARLPAGGTVRGGRGPARPGQPGLTGAAAGRRVRSRLGDHRGAQPGHHGGPADPGGARHRDPAPAPPQAPRVRVHPPGQLGVAAAAGVQPHEPAGVLGRRADPDPLRRADGAAVAGGDRRGVRGLPLVLRRGPDRGRSGRGPGGGGATPPDPAFRAGHGARHAGRIRADLAGRAEPGLGGRGRGGGAGGQEPGPRARTARRSWPGR